MNKVIKKEFRTEHEATLPNSGITIKFHTSLTVKEAMDLGIENKPEKQTEDGLKVLTKLITEWNYFASETDNDPLPITFDNIACFSMDDITFINSEIKKITVDKKKD